jgi:hypothetical protein
VLFTLSPKLRIYRSKGHSNSAYQWLNTKVRLVENHWQE